MSLIATKNGGSCRNRPISRPGSKGRIRKTNCRPETPNEISKSSQMDSAIEGGANEAN